MIFFKNTILLLGLTAVLTGCTTDNIGGAKITRHDDGSVQISASAGRHSKMLVTVTTEAFIRHCKLSRASFPNHESNVASELARSSERAFEGRVGLRIKQLQENPTICSKPKASS